MIDLFIFVGTLQGGGAERVAVELFNRLPLQISRKLITIYETKNAYHVNEVPIALCSYTSSRLLCIIKLPLYLLRYLNILSIQKPKVVISFLPLDNILNMLTSKIAGTLPIICIHGMPSNTKSLLDTIKKKFLYLLLQYFQVNIVAVSYGVKNELSDMYAIPSEKISVIYNPINVDEVSKLALETVDDGIFVSGLPTIITVGRLNKVKGQWHLLRVFAELRKMIPCRLIICGDGPEINYLVSLVNELNILGDVIFLGWQDNPFKYIAKSTLFVQSSISEALPNVLVESLACGCPVVAANCSPGITEILGSDSSCGFVAEKMTGICHTAHESLDCGELSLLYYIKKILENPELRDIMSSAGKNHAKLFDVDVKIREYTKLINALIINC